jgi:hypothetical protein
MTEFRRYARFQIIVSMLTAAAVLTILVVTRNVMASLAGFSVLALQGARGLSPVRGKLQPIQDERDEAIHRKVVAAGYSAFWAFLVIWGVSVPLAFMDRGRVPLAYVAPVVWVGWWLVTTVRALTALILDVRGS